MDYIRFHASLHPDRVAVTDLAFEREWNYRELDHVVACCVTVLREAGIEEGDRVGCLSANRAELIILHFACERFGALFVPLNWRLSIAEIEELVSDCTPSIIYGDGVVSGLSNPVLDINQLLDTCAATNESWPVQKSPDLPSLMLYTSGTTGKPKGVMLSTRNLGETAINTALLSEFDAESCFLCESPMFHIIGMVTAVRAPLFVGGRVTVSDAFIPERTFAQLTDEALQITHYFCVPTMAQAIRAVDDFDGSKLARLRALLTGGAPHPEPQIRDWLSDGVAIVDGFGMSEAGTVLGMPLDRRIIEQKAGCVGIPSSRVRARLVDAVGDLVGVDEAGELELQGDNIAVGYWGREETYQECFTDDGWFRTGDIMTRDEDGFYRVTDRKKDMFISGGENVYPVEVEAALDKFPGVVELAVIGVPDARWGEVGCIYYVSETDDVDVAEFAEYLGDCLARYKIPKQARRVESLPRTGIGKLKRHELRALSGPELD